jgi:hypothetical protein
VKAILSQGHPPRHRLRKALFFLVGGGLLLLGSYLLLLRPWHMRWGCTNEDLQRAMPADGIVPHPDLVTHRGISIAAPPSEVWPWLVQLGEGRGGFYSYDWIDHLLGFDINSADRILPEFQAPLTVGGIIPRGMYIWAVKPGEHLVVGTPPGMKGFQSTWALGLYPTQEGGTRLVSRLRMHYDDWRFSHLAIAAVLDPGQFIMEQKMLRNLKGLVEKGAPGPRSRP